MSGGARIAAYLGVLAALFAGAFALGNAFGGDAEEHGGGDSEHGKEHAGAKSPVVAGQDQEEEDGGHGGHGEEIGGSHGEAARGPGASDRHDLKLALEPAEPQAGRQGELAFRILDAGGEPLTRFDVEHTKQVHLIVVRKDLEQFHHVHPRADGDTWRVDLRPKAPGDYRVIADVKHEGRKLALTADLRVGGAERAVGRPAQEARFSDQKLVAGQPATLEFEAPGRTEPYLGAAGHLVVLREGDLEYLHVHPHEDELAFEAAFPERGRYVMFLEYKRDGEVRLSRFPVRVR